MIKLISEVETKEPFRDLVSCVNELLNSNPVPIETIDDIGERMDPHWGRASRVEQAIIGDVLNAANDVNRYLHGEDAFEGLILHRSVAYATLNRFKKKYGSHTS